MDRKGLNRTAIAAALAIVMAGALVAQAGTPTTPNAVVVEGHSNDRESAGNALDSRILASIDDATAAALIGALETRFAGREVALRMGKVENERASLRDIALHGTAQIRLDGDAAWLPIRFEALYDTDTQAVLSPAIVLEGTGVAAAPKLPLPGLQAQVRAAMGDEFASQDVDLSLRKAEVIGNDGSRLVVRAQGIARFDGSETAPVTVRALYEQGSGRWLDTQYDFDVVGG
ncbi:hypothetical protein [Thermomonas sp.]|uniref:hypothetical protein n=1 Tax=Thermomonas sp. TaxID=1971895 RepID=UPI0035B4EB45